MIKLILILGVITCSILIGVAIKKYLKLRVDFFEGFASLCEIISTEISFLKTDKKTMLSGATTNTICKSFVNDYIDHGYATLSILKNDEENKLNEFLNSIGKFDIDGEIKNIAYYKSFIGSYYSSANKKFLKYGDFSIKISILIGTIISIILF